MSDNLGHEPADLVAGLVPMAAETLIALADGFHRRATRSLGLRQVSGHMVKLYAIEAPGRQVGVAEERTFLDAVADELGGDRMLDSLGLACVIVHAGADGDYVIVHTWIGDYMSRLSILMGPAERPDMLQLAPPGLAPCVWEGAVLAHERQAYIDQVLCGSGSLEARLKLWADDVMPAVVV
jgi:hypothetical protein